MGLVLIIDDEKLICEELLDCVEALGRRGRSFCNPLLGLAFLSETIKDVDVIFVDAMMPEMDGETFISNAQKLTGINTRYFLMSGVPMLELQSISGQFEHRFLQKPLNFACVKECLT